MSYHEYYRHHLRQMLWALLRLDFEGVRRRLSFIRHIRLVERLAAQRASHRETYGGKP